MGTGPCPSGTQGWGDYREFITSVGGLKTHMEESGVTQSPGAQALQRGCQRKNKRLTSDLTQVPFIAIIN